MSVRRDELLWGGLVWFEIMCLLSLFFLSVNVTGDVSIQISTGNPLNAPYQQPPPSPGNSFTSKPKSKWGKITFRTETCV